MLPTQVKQIHKILYAYSQGNYRYRGKITGTLNELDSILSGINMLGEELLNSNVSRDYFSSIYNAVADMLFVVCPSGRIQKLNTAAQQLLGCSEEELKDESISAVIASEPQLFFKELKKQLRNKEFFSLETYFKTKAEKILPVACVCSKMYDRYHKFCGYLIIAEDITLRKAAAQRELRVIIDAQEKERKRIFMDLHDAVQQKIAALIMYINTLKISKEMSEQQFEYTLKQSEILASSSMKTLRNACFDLMPANIREQYNNIDSAIKTLIGEMVNIAVIHYKGNENIPSLEHPQTIMLYRVVQEFIGNTIKHAQAKNIYISLLHKKQSVILSMTDDGCGFNVEEKVNSGNGLNNIITRVKAFNGTYKLESKLNKGTTLEVVIPLT